MRTLAALCVLSACATPLLAQEKIAASVNAALARDARAPVLVSLGEQLDVAKITSKGDARLIASVNALRAHAQRTQAPLRAWLDERGIQYQAYWVANFIALEASAELSEQLAARGDIAKIELDAKFSLEKPVGQLPSAQLPAKAIETGVNQVNAPALWAMGFRGQDVLIAGQDTGYDWDHPALKSSYAGWDGNSANHDYHWFDAINSGGGGCGANSAEPCDDQSHGTHTMGTMVGDDGANNQIGVAPGARWIGCRNMDRGNGTPTTYSTCFQFFLAPTDRAGNNPDPLRAPHIINNSWGCPPSEGCVAPAILQTVVENVRNAGILVVVSAGNSGSSCSTVADPPAIYAASFSVGAVGGTSMANFSSRGPVMVDGSNRLKPDIVAPGVSTRSSVPGTGYSSMSGTSMAGPHVAGVAALLMSFDPTLKRDPARIEALMRNSAVADVSTVQTCGSISTSVIPNNTFGYGRIDALAATRSSLGMFAVNGFE